MRNIIRHLWGEGSCLKTKHMFNGVICSQNCLANAYINIQGSSSRNFTATVTLILVRDDWNYINPFVITKSWMSSWAEMASWNINKVTRTTQQNKLGIKRCWAYEKVIWRKQLKETINVIIIQFTLVPGKPVLQSTGLRPIYQMVYQTP